MVVVVVLAVIIGEEEDEEGAIGCSCCAIGAYDQECLDELLRFAPGPSGEKDYECAVYTASVGKRTE